jgi:HK97 family phage major capsid protein
MNLKQQRAAAIKAAQDIIAKAKAEERELVETEVAELEAKQAEIEDLTKRIDAAEKSADLVARIGSLGTGDPEPKDGDPAVAKSLGEHFAKSVSADDLSRLKSVSGHTLSIKEWTPPAVKGATDTNVTPGSLAPWGTLYDRTIVRGFRRPVVSDLFGVGNIGGMNSVTYLVEGAVEGAFATVAEGGAKPQVHMADPTTKTDALKKIAGFLKFTDENAEDFPFWVSEINQRGLYLLALAEENQLLNGAGTGSTVEGLLVRSGIQTEAAATGVSGADNADAIFRAMTKVQTATGLAADGIIINPADYQNLRLRKDGNGQYFGGGFFSGEYGNGGIVQQPPLWGLRTVVSSAVSAGTVVVGAFEASTTVYRKGGVRVESTNSHDDDFTNNLITTRIEERVALAVRIPAATVKVTLNYAAS